MDKDDNIIYRIIGKPLRLPPSSIRVALLHVYQRMERQRHVGKDYIICKRNIYVLCIFIYFLWRIVFLLLLLLILTPPAVRFLCIPVHNTYAYLHTCRSRVRASHAV